MLLFFCHFLFSGELLAAFLAALTGGVIGVAIGGTFGHCLATGLAVVGGSFISKYFFFNSGVSESNIFLISANLLAFCFRSAFF